MAEMAKRLDINFHPNTINENNNILNKLRSHGKIDNRNTDELTKLFNKLNAKDNKDIKIDFGTLPDQVNNNKTSVYGPIDKFPSGSWWGIRIDCSRDKVHSSFNDDICFDTYGAASICTSHLNPHNDVDIGDYLTFTSDEYNHKLNLSNHPMIKSFQNNIPIRVIRSHNLNNEFAPKTGYRYDGIYAISSFWIGLSSSSSKRYLKFSLSRIKNQAAPSWQINKNNIDDNLTIKRTRNKINNTATRCHMDCCKNTKNDGKLDLINKSTNAVNKNDKKPSNSQIVIRHVSKKFDRIIAPGIKSPVQNKITSTSTLTTLKNNSNNLHNPNLSIRTYLYDSSSDLLNDNKKINTNNNSRVQQKSSTCGVLKNSKIIDNVNIDKNKKNGIQLRSCVNKNDTKKTSKIINENLTNENNNKVIFENSTKENINDSSIETIVKQNRLSDALASIESLTPEQIMNLITKEKYKTTGKIIIGNIIGDTNFINKTLSKSPTIIKQQLIIKQQNNDKLKNNYYGKNNNDNNKKERLLNKPMHTRNKNQKPFSKLINIKKRRGELANLVIDANFTTKLRANKTRNLRRYPTRFLNKKRDNNIYIKKRQKIDIKNKLIKYNNNTKSTMKKHQTENNKIDKIKVTNDKLIENNKSVVNKLKMIDATTQCSLNDNLRMCVDVETQYDDPAEIIKIESTDFDDVKSESYESDNDSLQEVIYRHSEIPTYPRNPKKIINKQSSVINRIQSTTNNYGLSAFAPVANLSDIDNRISRLRSIGFKPIEPCLYYEQNDCLQDDNDDVDDGNNTKQTASCSTVVRKDVDAQYNKYTNEENNIVEYMDDELKYQEIENEESQSNGTKMFTAMLKKRNVHNNDVVDDGDDDDDNTISRSKRKYSSSVEEKQMPWQGWKKFIAKEGTIII
ncbi:hypothetical protein HCN44_002436 [Aphidius gifuensis]|uniref:YDG domain-containing protein n=1 Tax=Aphidius gifuensis TaxID=684658 RepID=A0A834Y2I6_APHGI|nr:putative uncharacterized protein DDB_G0282133 [Aphidius gifuensis]KAF7996790.1 hypothetical protein HCN44_002436 [Aphidius gifuensis]